MIDTTCPLVTLVHEQADRLHEQGYYIIIFGDKNHPEVKGIIGHAGENAIAVTRFEDLPWQVRRDDFAAPRTAKPPKKVAILSQTTMDIHAFTAFVNQVNEIALPIGGEVFVHNTICKPTSDRQLAVRHLAQEADADRRDRWQEERQHAPSTEISTELGVRNHHIQGPADLDPTWFGADVKIVGVTAGASTPDDVIAAVADRLREIADEPAPDFGSAMTAVITTEITERDERSLQSVFLSFVLRDLCVLCGNSALLSAVSALCGEFRIRGWRDRLARPASRRGRRGHVWRGDAGGGAHGDGVPAACAVGERGVGYWSVWVWPVPSVARTIIWCWPSVRSISGPEDPGIRAERLADGRRPPGLAAIRRDLDLRDAARPGEGDTAGLIAAGRQEVTICAGSRSATSS